MTSTEPQSPSGRGQSLEDEFFRREDVRLLERLKQKQATESAREGLAKATGIASPQVLDKLMELGIRAETVAALSIVPLVEVAWADRSLDAKERQAVLAGARTSGLAPDSVEYAMLETWLERRPEPKLLAAWTHLVQGLCAQLAPAEIAKMKAGLLDRARAVANASGGVLGMGSKVSGAEAIVLKRLEAAFDPKV
ncbi:MAG: hypothetical protein EPO68_14650 [Planctomycetota bacterium]|nr:MAG: hypothetical protein EPO68_14650 [Planctomycetota bacterium]